MRRRSILVTVLLWALAGVLFAGCAGGPKMARSEADLKPDKDAAVIIFVRPNPLSFGGADFSLWDRDHFIGLLDAMTSVQYRAKPGEHMFLVRAENWEIVKGKVAAGKTYYILVDPRVGVRGTRVSLSVAGPNDTRVKEWTARCRPVALADPAAGEAFEKKYEKHVNKAITNAENGRANFTTLSPQQGK